jgi:hypothetical protein
MRRHRAARAQVWEATPGCGGSPFLDTLWTGVDEAIELPDCDVYSYKSDGEADPFGARPRPPPPARALEQVAAPLAPVRALESMIVQCERWGVAPGSAGRSCPVCISKQACPAWAGCEGGAALVGAAARACAVLERQRLALDRCC